MSALYLLHCLAGCGHINDEGLTHLANNCHDLRRVTVHGCRNIQDEGIVKLAENCPNLSYLCVSNCGHLTDACLIALGNHCPQLSTLECAAVSQFTDTGFQVRTSLPDLELFCRVGQAREIHEVKKFAYKMAPVLH